MEERCEVLLRLPDFQPWFRHHHGQLREPVKNGVVNVFGVFGWCPIDPAKRSFDRVIAYHVHGDSSAESFANNCTNSACNMRTSAANARTTDLRDEKGMWLKIVKQFNEVWTNQPRNSDRPSFT